MDIFILTWFRQAYRYYSVSEWHRGIENANGYIVVISNLRRGEVFVYNHVRQEPFYCTIQLHQVIQAGVYTHYLDNIPEKKKIVTNIFVILINIVA